MTTVYVVLGFAFALAFACANPGFRLWMTAQKFKLRRSLGWGAVPSGSTGSARPPRAATRLPGDHAAADADAEAEAELAWRRRRAAQSQRSAKPGRATKESGGRRGKKTKPEEQQPMMPG